FEYVDEGTADDFPFLLRVFDAGQAVEELVCGVDVPDVQVELPKAVHDLLGFPLAQQPGVDEYTGQPIADSPIHQCGRDRGVDPARQRANGGFASHTSRDRGDLRLHVALGRPARLTTAHPVEEVCQ